MRKLLIIASLIMVLLGSTQLIAEGFSWSLLGAWLFFVVGALVIIFEQQMLDWATNRAQKKIQQGNCLLQTNSFYFPNGYYFNYGYLKDKKELPFYKITTIRTNTIPITAIVDNKEVIFLRGIKKEELVPLKEQTSLQFEEPLDNWTWLCEEFLDTELTPQEKQKIYQRLEENGIPQKEAKAIQKRLKFRMLMRTFATWEWIYYGQWDVLAELWPLNPEKYWWTMDIALRRQL